MKFTLIGPTYPFRGGIAHYTTLLYQALTERHQVEFISFKRQYPTWLFPGKTDQDTSSQPLTAPCLRLIDPLNPLTWWHTARQIGQYQPDVIIFQWWVPFWSPTFTSIAWLCHRWSNSRVVFICHNVLPHDRLRPGERFLIKVALKQGNHFIVHSDKDYRDLQQLLVTDSISKVKLPTYAAFADFEKNRVVSPPQQKEPVILFFGFVRPYKGLTYLLQAMPLVRHHISVRLLIVGEFWSDKEDYLNLIKMLQLTDHITLVDEYVPNEEIGHYFSQADLVVLPYVSATQSAVIQMAFGFHKPVITTDVGGLAEVVEHGKTGLVVPPRNSEALAKAIIDYFQHDLAPSFEANIRQKQTTFSWQQLVEQLEIIAVS